MRSVYRDGRQEYGSPALENSGIARGSPGISRIPQPPAFVGFLPTRDCRFANTRHRRRLIQVSRPIFRIRSNAKRKNCAAKEPQMTDEQMNAEIREANLTYLMLA